MEEEHPKVFISYSHGNAENQQRVLDFANHLRDEGIDAVIDQFEEAPSEGWPRWMEKQIKWADFVIILVSKSYLDKFENSTGKGVDWEVNIIYNMLYNANTETRKFIPAYFNSDDAEYIPTALQGYTRYNIEEEYDKLYNRLRGITAVKKRPLGNLKSLGQKKPKSIFFTSPIDMEKWDRAGWNGITYFLPGTDAPYRFPILGLTFKNYEAGVEIFKEWHENWGENYADDFITLNYIVPPFPQNSYAYKYNSVQENRNGYYVSIEPNVDEAINRLKRAGVNPAESLFACVSRYTWVNEQQKGQPRKNFEQQLAASGQYGIIAAHIKRQDTVYEEKALTTDDFEVDLRYMIRLKNFKEKRGVDLSKNDISSIVLEEPLNL